MPPKKKVEETEAPVQAPASSEPVAPVEEVTGDAAAVAPTEPDVPNTDDAPAKDEESTGTAASQAEPDEVEVEAIMPLNKKGHTIPPKGKTTLPRQTAEILESVGKINIIKE